MPKSFLTELYSFAVINQMQIHGILCAERVMCGNGIRCVAKYAYDYGIVNKTSISVATKSGVKYLDLSIRDGKVSMVKVNMGAPILQASLIPVVSESEQVVNAPIEVDGQIYHFTAVSMGNPHFVTFVEDVATAPVEKVGRVIEHSSYFPERVNVEFVEIVDDNHVKFRVWERGSGETLACGTGACATAVAAVLNGHCNGEILIHLLGGDLKIEWDKETNHVFMTGPAAISFEGEINL